MTGLTATGFQVDRLDAVQAQLVEGLVAIFGQFDSDPDTVDGQWTGILAESEANLNELAEAVVQSFNPATATGAALSLLVMLNGITRKQATYGVVTLQLEGNENTLVPAGSLVTAADKTSTWTTLDDTLIGPSGIATVTAQCTVLGVVNAELDTLTTMSTPIAGWLGVTNEAAATPGTAIETDQQLRIRRAASVSYPALGVYDALYGALDNLPGVTNLQLYMNDTDSAAVTADNLYGLPAHSIYAVVQGGLEQDILDTLWRKKGTGVYTVGTTRGTTLDSAGNQHVVGYDVPAPYDVYLTINVKRKAAWPTNGVALMTAALMAFAADYKIGDPVIVSELYTPINTVPGISVTSLYAGTLPAPAESLDLATPFNALAMFDPSRIVINLT